MRLESDICSYSIVPSNQESIPIYQWTLKLGSTDAEESFVITEGLHLWEGKKEVLGALRRTVVWKEVHTIKDELRDGYKS